MIPSTITKKHCSFAAFAAKFENEPCTDSVPDAVLNVDDEPFDVHTALIITVSANRTLSSLPTSSFKSLISTLDAVSSTPTYEPKFTS